MTTPRRILPANRYLVTRRCSERRFFLRPDPRVTHIFEYLLAYSCQQFAIELHAFVVMSNHYHLVVTDRYGQLPAFLQYLNSFTARAINAYRERRGSFWEREPYSAVELLEGDAVIAKMAYTELNPVRAGLVGRAADWGGATSAGQRFGHKRVIPRPEQFFRGMPDQVTLELTAPEGLGDRHDIQSVLEAITSSAEEDARLTRPRPMGMRRVMARDWRASAITEEPRRSIRPRFASRCRELMVAAIRAYREWLNDYRRALAEFREGNRDVRFPPGSYRMGAILNCPLSPRVALTG